MVILSVEELNQVRRELERLPNALTEYVESIELILNAYMNDATAQSFFASGNFGKSQYEDLLKIKQGLTVYLDATKNKLIPTTINYVNRQLSLNNRM